MTPTLLAKTAFPSRSPGIHNRGPGGPASLGHVPKSSIFSPTGLISKLINRGPEGSFCWVLAFSTASCLRQVWSPNSHSGAWGPSLSGCWLSLPHLVTNWSGLQTDFLSSLSYIIVQRPLLLVGVTISHSFTLFTVKVIISWSTGFTCYLHRCISYFDSPAGS